MSTKWRKYKQAHSYVFIMSISLHFQMCLKGYRSVNYYRCFTFISDSSPSVTLNTCFCHYTTSNVGVWPHPPLREGEGLTSTSKERCGLTLTSGETTRQERAILGSWLCFRLSSRPPLEDWANVTFS